MNAWENNIRKVVPYTPGEQPKRDNMIKLNTNENPYPPSPTVKETINNMNEDLQRRYPDPTSELLNSEIAKFYGVKTSQVFTGVGSDDVLSIAFLTFFNSEKPILFPDITYSFYKVWADVYRIPYTTKQLDENFKIVKEDYYEANGGVIFPNPNAPTSIYMDLDDVEDIIKHNQDVIVIIDEAYIDFGGKSALSLIDKYDNLVIVQTYSKSRSLAGMRIGYAISGNERLIKAMNDVKYSINSYTMNQASIYVGTSVMKDREYFESVVNKIIATREKYKVELERLGFDILPSKANFFFATHKSVKAKYIFEKLRERNIFVRYFEQPRIDNYLRITVGTDEEMQGLVEALEQILRKN